MIQRSLGDTGLAVSALGFGAGHIGSPDLSEDEAGTVLNRAVDLGVTLIDTARGYGLSEERIGRHLSWRRHEVVISTKGGYGVPGVPDWTPESITRGIDDALGRLRTDHIDVFHLHSCPLDTLRRDDLLAALHAAVQEGKVRVAGYSGDNEALEWAVRSERFGAVEASVNFADQRAIDAAVLPALARGVGVIAKRPLANAPWRFATRPAGHYAETYWLRWHAMQLDASGLDWDELALRFAAFLPGVSSCIAGTRRPEHLERNAAIIERGPLPVEVVHAIRDAFRREDDGWTGQV